MIERRCEVRNDWFVIYDSKIFCGSLPWFWDHKTLKLPLRFDFYYSNSDSISIRELQKYITVGCELETRQDKTRQQILSYTAKNWFYWLREQKSSNRPVYIKIMNWMMYVLLYIYIFAWEKKSEKCTEIG